MNDPVVIITSESGGYDISVYCSGQKIKSAWKYDQSGAQYQARIFADYYTNSVGQIAQIKQKNTETEE